MKIKGEVEVFKIMQNGASESVLKESNMVVDGASEVIVDMLTTPYSLKNFAGSESLNPSNFTIQAVSLGKAERLYGGHPDTSAADTDVIGMHCVWDNSGLQAAYAATGHTTLLGDSWVGARNPIEGASSYTPSRALPKEPFPRDISLEKSSKTQIELYYDLGLDQYDSVSAPQSWTFGAASGWNDASNIIPPNGHNLNSLYGQTAKSMESLFQGCYAPSDGMDIYLWKSQLTREVIMASPGPMENMVGNIHASAGDVSGRYNTVGSMDKDGYLVAYPIQDHPASGDTTQGVAVSAATTSSLTNVTYTEAGLLDGDGSAAFIANPAVCYNFTISSTDLLCLAAYKGVTNIGLWAFDLKETLKQEAAPIAWTTPTNNRKYKLFAKKVFSEDITSIQDNATAGLDQIDSAGIANYSDLTIQWRINFDFGRTF